MKWRKILGSNDDDGDWHIGRDPGWSRPFDRSKKEKKHHHHHHHHHCTASQQKKKTKLENERVIKTHRLRLCNSLWRMINNNWHAKTNEMQTHIYNNIKNGERKNRKENIYYIYPTNIWRFSHLDNHVHYAITVFTVIKMKKKNKKKKEEAKENDCDVIWNEYDRLHYFIQSFVFEERRKPSSALSGRARAIQSTMCTK